ncbi:MAG: ISAs1 family transposase [Chloroflexia bacterium]
MDKRHYKTMMEALADMPDPRRKRGVRHNWRLLLMLVGAAKVSGQQHGRAIAQWVGEHTESLTQMLELPPGGLPSESTLRRALRDLDVEELEQRVAQLTQGMGGEATEPSESLVGWSMDGKQVCGAKAHGRSMHLLSVVSHEDAMVLAQVQVGEKTNEISAAGGLLAKLELSGTVVTMDALLTQRKTAEQILEQGGHYLMVVKSNQRRLHEAIAELFDVGGWLPSEIGTRYWKYTSSEKGHGRLESRTLESSTVFEG